jgi:hypothetical protein
MKITSNWKTQLEHMNHSATLNE